MSSAVAALSSFLTTLPVTLPAFAVLGFVALALLGWGRAALGPGAGADAAEEHALALAAGFAGVGLALFALGLLGQLRAGAVATLALAGIALCFRLERPRPRLVVEGLGLAVALVLGSLLAYPLTGWDPAMYRLPTARAFAVSGGLPFVPELRFPIGPQLGEVLFAGALTLGSERFARGLVFLALLGTVTLAYAWARRLFGTPAGLVAAALVVGSPGAVLYGTDAYVDVLQAFFTVAALAAADRAREGADEARCGRLGVLAGALAGAGAAIRYTGLLAAVVIPVALWASAPRGRRRRRGLPALLGVLAVAAPWYLRAAFVTGNPLFPLGTGVFGPNAWDLGPLAKIYGSPGFFSFLGRLLLLPESGPPVFDPWLTVLLPLAGFGAWREPRLRLPVALAASLLVATWATAPDPRFGLPALAPLALAVAGGLAGLGSFRRAARPVVAVITLLLAAPGFLYTGYRLGQLGPVPRDAAATARFLARRVPGYSLVAELERLPGPPCTVYAYYGERLRFYSRHRWLGDTSGPYRWRLVEAALVDPTALARALRGFGAQYFVWVRGGQPEPPWLATGGPGLEPWFADEAGAIYRVSPADQAAARAAATSSRISGVE